MRIYTRIDVSERFWDKVDKTGDCWLWTASLNKSGYGQIAGPDRPLLAHRVSWALTFGDIPDDLCVLHKCDNPACVNPNHLFLGTRTDNAADKVSKNRQLKGESHKASHLTNADVIEIRKIYADGQLSQYQLARIYDIGQTAVCKIINKKRWAHL